MSENFGRLSPERRSRDRDEMIRAFNRLALAAADFEGLPPEPQTRDEAWGIIERIRFKYGVLSDYDRVELAKTSPDWRRKLEESMRDRNRTLASSTKTQVSRPVH